MESVLLASYSRHGHYLRVRLIHPVSLLCRKLIFAFFLSIYWWQIASWLGVGLRPLPFSMPGLYLVWMFAGHGCFVTVCKFICVSAMFSEVKSWNSKVETKEGELEISARVRSLVLAWGPHWYLQAFPASMADLLSCHFPMAWLYNLWSADIVHYLR